MHQTLEPARSVPFGLTEEEAFYAKESRAANTQRAYLSAWVDFIVWAAGKVGPDGNPLVVLDGAGHPLQPVAPEVVNGYILVLASAGAKVGTMGQRLAAISDAHEMSGLPSPTHHPRVKVVWKGIRRVHQTLPNKAPPLMPPLPGTPESSGHLWDVVDRLPATAAGDRDAAILLVGFAGALRRSELGWSEKTQIGARVEHLSVQDRGLVLTIPESKGDKDGKGQLVVLPRSREATPSRCPVLALERWLDRCENPTEGPLLRTIHHTGSVQAKGITGKAVNEAIQRACTIALGPDHGYSAHSLRAGLVTYTAARGATDWEIMAQTRHKDPATVAGYVRQLRVWDGNAAADLGL